MKRIKNNLINFGFLIKFCLSISKSVFIFGVLDTIIQAIYPVVFLILSSNIIDTLTKNELSTKIFLQNLIIFIAVTGLLKVIQIITTYFYNVSNNISDIKTNIYFANQSFNMDYSKFEDSNVRDNQSKFRYQLSVSSIFNEIFRPFILGSIQVIAYSYIILSLNLFIFIIVLASLLTKQKIYNKLNHHNMNMKEIKSYTERRLDYLFFTMSQISWAKEVRINKLLGLIQDKYFEYLKDYKKSYNLEQNRTYSIIIINNLIDLFLLISQYGYATFLAIGKKISIGRFSLFVGAMLNFSSALNEIVSAFSVLNANMYISSEYKKFVDNIESKDEGEKINLENDDYNEIEFRNVCFTYPNSTKEVLKDISFKINSSDRLAIVGYNGAGKSTMIKLLCRLYKPISGHIFYNGIDIQSIDIKKYKELIGTILQDFKLFAIPLWQNITLDKEKDDEKIIDALVNANVYKRVSKLENGINTEVTKILKSDGIEFSGGESQKIAMGRMYYKDASIMLMDEPTSALDPKSELEVYNQFDKLMGEKTSVYITHRLGSISFCNKIIVLDKGVVREIGNHLELMKNEDLYFEMYTKQASYYKEDLGDEEKNFAL